MENSLNTINNIIIELFNDILHIEESTLKSGPLKSFTISEIHTVDAIGLFDKKSMTETSKKLNITVGTLTTAVNNLVKKGIAERYKNLSDRRVVMIGLTKKGKVLFRVHEKFHRNLIGDVLSELSEEEKRVLIKTLRKIHLRLMTKYKK